MNLFENLQMLKESQNDIEIFINTPVEELDANFIKTVVNEYFAEYDKLPRGMEATNPEYNEVKGLFYNKYYNFAKKCKEIANSTSVSGYGRNDYSKLRIKDMCDKAEYIFPYGWRQFGKVRESLQSCNENYNIEEIKNYWVYEEMMKMDYQVEITDNSLTIRFPKPDNDIYAHYTFRYDEDFEDWVVYFHGDNPDRKGELIIDRLESISSYERVVKGCLYNFWTTH